MALRRHHLEGLANRHRLEDPGRERPTRKVFHPDPQLTVGLGPAGLDADRVRPAQVDTVDLMSQRQVLAGFEREGVSQLRWHRQRERDRVVSEGVDRGDRQVVPAHPDTLGGGGGRRGHRRLIAA
jgi:hypothetical protein